MNEFIKTIVENKLNYPELIDDLDAILDMVTKAVKDEIEIGDFLVKKLIRQHEEVGKRS